MSRYLDANNDGAPDLSSDTPRWAAYAKGIVAFLGFVLTTAIALDWGYEFPQWVPALSSLLTALAVYLTPNKTR